MLIRQVCMKEYRAYERMYCKTVVLVWQPQQKENGLSTPLFLLLLCILEITSICLAAFMHYPVSVCVFSVCVCVGEREV